MKNGSFAVLSPKASLQHQSIARWHEDVDVLELTYKNIRFRSRTALRRCYAERAGRQSERSRGRQRRAVGVGRGILCLQ